MLRSAVMAFALLALPVTAQAEQLSVAVFPLQALKLDEAVGTRFTTRVMELMREQSTFSVVMTPAEISKKLSYKEQQQLLACLEDRCAIVDETLVAHLGVSHLLRASMRTIGETHVLTMVLLDLKSARQLASISEALQSMTEPVLLAAADKMVERMLERASMRKAAPVAMVQPAPAPAPAPAATPAQPAPVPEGPQTNVQQAPQPIAPAPIQAAPATATSAEESGSSTTAVVLLAGGSGLALLGVLAGLGAVALIVGGVAMLGASAAAPSSRDVLLAVGAVCAVVGLGVGLLAGLMTAGGAVMAVMGQRM